MSYFIGSFVFNYEYYDDEDIIDVIDGQQRLLTITIFMAVLRDIAINLGHEKFGKIIERKNICDEDDDGNYSPRIIPGESSKEFFEDYIQFSKKNIKEVNLTKLKEEHKKIVHNYNYLKDQVEKDISKFSALDDKINSLKSFRKKIQNMKVIRVQLYSEEDAYEIFETVNARGEDLTVSDLLKNLLFKKIGRKLNKDIIINKWASIEENVRNADTDLKKFLRYFWLSKYDFVTEKVLFRKIKYGISDHITFLEDLYDASNNYLKIDGGTEQDWSDIKDGYKIYAHLNGINIMKVSQCNVLFLSILRNFDKLEVNPKRIFDLIEKFTFVYSSICKQPGNKVERIYSRYARDLEKAVNQKSFKRDDVNRLFDNLEKELKEIKPSPELFKEHFMKLSYKNSKKSRMLVKYIFEKINDTKNNYKEHSIDFNVVNIEHLLPQKPNQDWNLTLEEIKPYVDKLGNLTILSHKINSKLGNSPISEKIGSLRDSKISITEELVNHLESLNFQWGEKEILERQEEFAHFGYHHVWNF